MGIWAPNCVEWVVLQVSTWAGVGHWDGVPCNSGTALQMAWLLGAACCCFDEPGVWLPSHAAVCHLQDWRHSGALVCCLAACNRSGINPGMPRPMRCGTHLPGAWLTATWTPQAVQPSFPRNRRLQVNINPAYRAGELTYALNQAGVSALVLARGLRGSREFIDIVDSVAEKTQLKYRVLLADEAPEGESLGVCGAGACCARVHRRS